MFLEMHLAIGLFITLMVWYRGSWRSWEKYHSTMLFFGFMELLYNLIVCPTNYFLWKIIPDLYMTRVPTISLYVFIIFPGTALLYLSGFPRHLGDQALYITKWVFIYIFIEALAYHFKRIEYFNGWNLWHSFIFDIILFSGLLLHAKKAGIAYIIFILVTILGIWGYGIPV